MPTVAEPDGDIRRLPCVGVVRASVIVLHGYAASASVNLTDGEAFVDEHTDVLLPDAPGHGARRDGTIEKIEASSAADRRTAIVELATKWAQELPALATRCRKNGAKRVGLVGISMGGIAAFASLDAASFDAVAAVLAWPADVDESRLTPGRPPLLVGLAGRDEAVPPEPARRFAARYGAELREYPESGHHMRGEDWRDLWTATAAFMRRHLEGPHRDA